MDGYNATVRLLNKPRIGAATHIRRRVNTGTFAKKGFCEITETLKRGINITRRPSGIPMGLLLMEGVLRERGFQIRIRIKDHRETTGPLQLVVQRSNARNLKHNPDRLMSGNAHVFQDAVFRKCRGSGLIKENCIQTSCIPMRRKPVGSKFEAAKAASSQPPCRQAALQLSEFWGCKLRSVRMRTGRPLYLDASRKTSSSKASVRCCTRHRETIKHENVQSDQNRSQPRHGPSGGNSKGAVSGGRIPPVQVVGGMEDFAKMATPPGLVFQIVEA